MKKIIFMLLGASLVINLVSIGLSYWASILIIFPNLYNYEIFLISFFGSLIGEYILIKLAKKKRWISSSYLKEKFKISFEIGICSLFLSILLLGARWLGEIRLLPLLLTLFFMAQAAVLWQVRDKKE